MAVNVKMWGTALKRLVMIEDRCDWDELDVVSKWLIATRAAVTTVTIYSCAIAGLLAWRAGGFILLPWLILTVGLFLSHGTNNLLNDLTDYRRGVDNNNYFRTKYGVHPLVQGFWDKRTQVRWFLVSAVLGVASAVYALFYTNFDPIVIALIAYGALMLFFYTYPLKHFALGELTIFIIWGPVIIAGLYYVLVRQWSWEVVIAGIPFGLSTASINVGKHIDKSGEDRKKHVTTLPVLLGQRASRFLNMAVIVFAYLVTLYLIFVTRFFTPVMLIVFIAAPLAWKAIALLAKPRPEEAPAGYPIWPLWYSHPSFMHNRRFGNLFVLGIVLGTVLRIIPATSGFWH